MGRTLLYPGADVAISVVADAFLAGAFLAGAFLALDSFADFLGSFAIPISF